MKSRAITVAAALATMLFCAAGWPQQTSTGTSTQNVKSDEKEKHLSGSLVDVGCMVKALKSAQAQSPQSEPVPGVPHFAGESPQAVGVPQVPAGQGGTPQGQGQQNTQPMNVPSTPDTSAADQARLEQEARIDNAVKSCTPTTAAQTLGLEMSGGRLVQFDPSGSAKAKEALKDADVQHGKKIKAKVTGTMEDKYTLNVASIDIKTKAKRASGRS